jgi:multidrug efflux pump subunit AcrB
MLKRPYKVISGLILIALLGIGAVSRMPIDIFPEIDVPVVAVVWTYNGMPARVQNRILTLHERQLASEVDDIERIEATSYYGVGVAKIFLHQGADVTRAIAQLSSRALVVLKYMSPNITPPLVLRYGATDVPIIQLSLSSPSLPDSTLNDLGQNIIRPNLAVVQGAEVPYPYGGKPRVIMADLDQDALNARGLTPSDVAKALQRQNVILPSGDVKIGNKDYSLLMNNKAGTRAGSWKSVRCANSRGALDEGASSWPCSIFHNRPVLLPLSVTGSPGSVTNVRMILPSLSIETSVPAYN